MNNLNWRLSKDGQILKFSGFQGGPKITKSWSSLQRFATMGWTWSGFWKTEQMGVCGGNLTEGRRTHSEQWELDRTSSNSWVMSVILARVRSVLDNKKIQLDSKHRARHTTRWAAFMLLVHWRCQPFISFFIGSISLFLFFLSYLSFVYFFL